MKKIWFYFLMMLAVGLSSTVSILFGRDPLSVVATAILWSFTLIVFLFLHVRFNESRVLMFKLEEQTQIQNLWFETMRDMPCIMKQSRFIFLGPQWSRNLGYSEKELSSVPVLDFIHPEDRNWVSKKFEDVNRISSFEARFKHKSGHWLWLEWNLSPSENGERTFASARDITHWNNSKEASIRDLRVANVSLERFASVAAHQLRSPPRGIIGAVGIILEDYKNQLPKEAIDFLNDIRLDALLMSNIVDGLYRISSFRDKTPLKTQNVSLSEIFDEIKDTLNRQRHPGRLIYPESLPTVKADRSLLIEALTNLVDNGLKFNSSSDKTVEISTDCSEDVWVKIGLKDNGIGIDLRYRNKLFGLFERLRTDYEGTGVGLYLAKVSIEKMGGRIDVSSEVGKGSTFWIILEGGSGLC